MNAKKTEMIHFLSSVSTLAEWAAHMRCQEIFDACGEIFEKQSYAVEGNSSLGLRLAFFSFENQLSLLIGDQASLHELLVTVDSIVSVINFPSSKNDLFYVLSSEL